MTALVMMMFDAVNTVFYYESYCQSLFALPAGGVFQTEPPGGYLRQAK